MRTVQKCFQPVDPASVRMVSNSVVSYVRSIGLWEIANARIIRRGESDPARQDLCRQAGLYLRSRRIEGDGWSKAGLFECAAHASGCQGEGPLPQGHRD